MPIDVKRRRASWSVVAEVWIMTWQPGIILGGYLGSDRSVQTTKTAANATHMS